MFTQINLDELWRSADSGGWRPSSAPQSDWPSPPSETNGYLRVRCNGGLNQQRTAICNAVRAARIMNATLVLPELDANSFWHDDSGFGGIYDVEHFIKLLRYDVKIVEKIPEIRKNGKTKKIKAVQLRPPRDSPISWYTTDALAKMKEHGAIYLTPFSHRLVEEIDNPEYQRLRCRVNYHALRSAMRFNNSTRIYLAAVDYMVCLLSDIFIPLYDGPSNFANNLLGHRLYYGFRTTIRPDRKALAPIFIDREKGRTAGFEEAVRKAMLNTNLGGPHKRTPPESFYTNSWPECFCQTSPKNPADKCPPDNVLEILDSQLSEVMDGLESNSTISVAEG
ncbi:hypothetical protein C1H46_033115 [Malus baccata]|uniref:O-fucosyltransferase family protein n=1 Tax=Malus baccata TaxID=106549 RepID=A0A540L4Z4_MALBA|nr:hypothetical protein C1H46_033115 [Malus baccata]